MNDFEKTDIYDIVDYKRDYTKEILIDVITSIKHKGYNPIDQILGYLDSNNPLYIPRDNGAREKISKLKKEEIIETLLRFFIEENKC